MDADLLRRACEVAGLTFYMRDDVDPCFQLRDRLGNGPWWDADDPALPSYASDVLVGMVMLTDKWCRHDFLVALARACDPLNTDVIYAGIGFATPEQKITAALAVLEAGDG